MAWAAATAWACVLRRSARSLGETSEALSRHRAAQAPLRAEHAAFVAVIVSGLLLMESLGWSVTRARWLGLKLGLVVFLLLPLEGMHAFISETWIARGLRQADAPPFPRLLERGLGIEQMLRTLELVLLAPGVPLLVWLSVAKPF